MLANKDSGEQLLLRIPEAAVRLSLSRSKLYELISLGEIRAVHIGRAVRIPSVELERWVQRVADEETAI